MDQTPVKDNVDEKTLLKRARRGDREAFGQLVVRHQAAVFRIVRGILARRVDCEDVTQEVFLRAYANLGRFREESGLFTWLYRIAVNEALRARRRRKLVIVETLPEREAPRSDRETAGPSPAALQQLLGRLPDDYRAIVVLRDLEGMTYREISDTLRIPMGTVESRLFRARQELRTMWKSQKEARHAL